MSTNSTVEQPTAKVICQSYDAFLAWMDEDVRAEWVDGEVEIMSPVSDRHQRIQKFLLRFFESYLDDSPIGEVFFESYQMKTGASLPGRVPDLIFLADEHKKRNRHTYIDGPGDLVVEIVSMDSRTCDRAEKYYEYEQGGVREYWLIDPMRDRAEFYVLDSDGKYALMPIDGAGFYSSTVLPNFKIKPEWFWQEPLPSLRSTLQEAGIGHA